MANSKKKGNRFELKVSKWFTEFSGYKFQRVPYSGEMCIRDRLRKALNVGFGKDNNTTTGGAALKFYASIRVAFYAGRSITVKHKRCVYETDGLCCDRLHPLPGER